MRTIGFLMMLLGGLATWGELKGFAIPTARWFFEASRELPWLHFAQNGGTFSKTGFDVLARLPWIEVPPGGGAVMPWFGWLSVGILIVGGLLTLVGSFTGGPPNPVTVRRIRRFREIKRGYYSLVVLIALGGIASLDQVLVGKRALAVHHDGEWVFPAFLPKDLKNRDFGIEGDLADVPADYREMKRRFAETGKGRVIMPLIPFDPTGDTLPPRSRPLVQREGIFHETGSRNPYSGLVARYHDIPNARMHLRHTMRKGVLQGPVDGWDAAGAPVYNGEFRNGKMLRDRYSGPGTKDEFLALQSSDFRAVKYHPAPPIPEEGNWLGTNSLGNDVLAYLFGGLQVNFKAALIYLPIVYLIGISIGLMMGYFGGLFDLVVQRLIEIFSNMPFLLIVIIFSSMVPERFKGLPVILTILILFGWMGMTYLMRTAAYRDKERDYIAAARVLGAGTPRILFRHLLPNTVAIIVTLVPFTMSGLIFSLTALDYLGFGLPPEYATWGRLLGDGLSNLSSPWLVTSTFVVLVSLLVLITFVGEAVREAFDPKKFSYYR
jgi:microcin C transport system permease protein